MPGGRLISDIELAHSDLDRASHLRSDEGFHGEQRGAAMAVIVRRGELAVRDGRLVQVPVAQLHVEADVSFLGLAPGGQANYAVRVSIHGDDDHPDIDHPDVSQGDVEWKTLREVGPSLGSVDAGLAVTAVALDHWRARTARCSRCGGPMVVTQGGWALHCADDDLLEFPRMDPAAIVLVIRADGRAALGRHVGWPIARYSTFAGFVEAGESAEAAAVREVFEETGLRIDPERLEYLGSQPWPFPRSLMLGFHAHTTDTEFRLDHQEIEDARWFSRDELRSALASEEIMLPPPLSISRRLVSRWLDAPE